jgi:hypothetical protein
LVKRLEADPAHAKRPKNTRFWQESAEWRCLLTVEVLVRVDISLKSP